MNIEESSNISSETVYTYVSNKSIKWDTCVIANIVFQTADCIKNRNMKQASGPNLR